MATVTTPINARQPKFTQQNVIGVRAVFITTGNNGADTIQMVKVPNGATILDVRLASPANLAAGGANAGFSVGDGGDTARFIATASYSSTAGLQTLNQANGLGYQYSLSDDANPLWDSIDITFTGTVTASVTFTMTVMYTMDGVR